MVGFDKRVICGNFISCTYAVGQVIMALIAWCIPNWRTFTQVIYAPSLLFIFYFFVIEESVRWLLSKGYKKEAATIIFKAADYNKVKLSSDAIKQLTDEPQHEESKAKYLESQTPNEKQNKEPSLMKQIFKSKIIIGRLCTCCFCWITVTFIYYGLSINSVSLGGNKYVNYALSALVEIPGYCLSMMTLDRFGRKKPIMCAYFICGLSLIILPFLPVCKCSQNILCFIIVI
jgi:MFS transporter, OCT family, solute carrier family 22 (organic cation transporter), member 4/5